MPQKIHYKELLEKLSDPNVDEKTLQPYFTAEYDQNFGLAPKLAINPETVNIDGFAADPHLTRGNIGLGFLNKVYQRRRQRQFRQQLKDSPEKPILLAEGDSWFEYPLWLEDTIDHLNKDYNVFCLSAAGDELKGIIAEAEYKEYLDVLIGRENLSVQAMLLSGGGNDIVGEYLLQYLTAYDANLTSEKHITQIFDQKLSDIKEYYRQAIKFINQNYPGLPILIHGYDHANPLPPQDFNVPPRDGWIGKWMREKGINQQQQQKEIVTIMIDRFYQQLFDLIKEHDIKNVYLVDNRGLVQNTWYDELHPNDAGFARVAEQFRKQLIELGIK